MPNKGRKVLEAATGGAVGRPAEYPPEVADTVLAGLRRTGNLRRVCRGDGMPDESTVRGWVAADPDGFGKAYREARDIGLDAMADETLDIADDSRNDTQVGEDGKELVDFDHIQRSRLRVDTRKWYLSKLAPKRYGDSARIEHTGADGGPIELTWEAPQAVQAGSTAHPGDGARDVTPKTATKAPAPPVLEGEALAVEWGDAAEKPNLKPKVKR